MQKMAASGGVACGGSIELPLREVSPVQHGPAIAVLTNSIASVAKVFPCCLRPPSSDCKCALHPASRRRRGKRIQLLTSRRELGTAP